jgi:protein-S-isoprenylcysteine O-methyltransferase Ste14
MKLLFITDPAYRYWACFPRQFASVDLLQFIMMVLIINLLLKIRYEEKQMNLSYCNKYREYSAGTWQLIPYVL